jgi:hypothetical protein
MKIISIILVIGLLSQITYSQTEGYDKVDPSEYNESTDGSGDTASAAFAYDSAPVTEAGVLVIEVDDGGNANNGGDSGNNQSNDGGYGNNNGGGDDGGFGDNQDSGNDGGYGNNRRDDGDGNNRRDGGNDRGYGNNNGGGDDGGYGNNYGGGNKGGYGNNHGDGNDDGYGNNGGGKKGGYGNNHGNDDDDYGHGYGNKKRRHGDYDLIWSLLRYGINKVLDEIEDNGDIRSDDNFYLDEIYDVWRKSSNRYVIYLYQISLKGSGRDYGKYIDVDFTVTYKKSSGSKKVYLLDYDVYRRGGYNHYGGPKHRP